MYEKCPYCGSDKINGNICGDCHKNLEWVDRICKKSIVYYNQGYERAYHRDLSGAKELLIKAVFLDKYNIQARNLLGLVFFEMGDVGEALKQWVMSHSIKKQDNIASDYIKRMQEDFKKLENYKEALMLYNKALNYFAKNNEDMAIIRLKKAINLLPNFIQAKNLLAAYYIQQNQSEKALEQVTEVLAIDEKNTQALSYLKEMTLSEMEEGRANLKKDYKSFQKIPQNKVSHPNKMINRGHILRNRIIYFIVGVLCMFAVQIGLIMPTKTQSLEAELSKAITMQKELENTLKETESRNNEKFFTLEEQNKKLKADNEEMQQDNYKLLQKERISSVNDLKDQRKWVEAAEILYNIAAKDLEEQNKQTYEQLKEQVFPRAAQELYNQGYGSYTREQFAESKGKLEKVVLYVPGQRVAGDALYYMGKIEESTNNLEKAKQYYNTLIKDYQGSRAAYRAQDRLNNLK